MLWNLKDIYFLTIFLCVFFIALANSLPHAILTPLLLSKGVSIADIAVIQAMFSLAILLFEIPGGVGRICIEKMLYMLSNLALILTFLIIIVFDNFYFLCLAWLIYRNSAALSSGTLDAQIINDIKNSKILAKESFINKFLKYSSLINTASLLLGSLLGSFLYFKIGVSIYILAIIFVLCSMLCIIMFF